MTIQVAIGGQELGPVEVTKLLTKYGLWPRLAAEIILDQAMEETGNLDVNETEIQITVNQWMQKQGIQSEAELKNWLARNGLDEAEMVAVATRPLKIEKFKQVTWGSNLEAYFVERKHQLDQVTYSLLRTKDGNMAQELYFRILDDGSTFRELAKQYSQGPEAQTGGLVGPVELGIPHPQIVAVLKSAKPGMVNPPIKIGEWYAVLRLEKMLPAKLDEAMRQRLINEQFEKWLREAIQEKLVIESYQD
ncbi:peptidylprolyl isomerase (plasmid) [Picosynechococcus sp. PCC 11901]|nr:peptidylprolyl isomerase [Picosynechococcus sp. PCC 11901]QCS48017.1 peptidylprolyl isomerase [Picosynechococcus sp. PCC 11901]